MAIPVFSIHGNHDDPTEEGNFAALDLLAMSGLVNYFGRTPQSDNITIKPVCLQKGRTKLALYGMSNVRDERLFRTFRDQKAKFFQPGTAKNEWFNLMAVHQNHHAHTQTGYLPENFLPEFLDLVIWGHEHECLIEPRYNPEMNFHVMQPGSSVATSLMPGEAVTKKVALLKVTGKEFKVEPIRLKSVRPFIMREIVLAEERALKNIWKKDNNRTQVTRHLEDIVNEMIAEAKQEYRNAQDEDVADVDIPRPLIRLRVEFSAPDGGRFDIENAQRFSNRFGEKVANTSDVVQFHRKKTAVRKKQKDEPDMPDDDRMDALSAAAIPVERLVREFLEAQSLSILPHNQFGEAVSQFIEKSDHNRVTQFVAQSLHDQVEAMMALDDNEDDDEKMEEAMDKQRARMEEMFAKGLVKHKTTRRIKPKPVEWDSEMDGAWEDSPASVYHAGELEDDDDDDAVSVAGSTKSAGRGRGGARGRGRGGRAAAATASTRTTKAKAAPKKAAAATKAGGRSKKVVQEESEDDDEESDEQMILDDDDEDDEGMFVKPAPDPARKKAAPAVKKAPAPRKSVAAPATQSRLNFSQPTPRAAGGRSASKAKPAAVIIVS